MKIAMAMSGGVDSSLVAALLKEQGCEVVGVYLDCWSEPGCRVDQNRKDAMRVGLKLGIPMKVINFRKEYKKRVMAWFFEEVKKGRTPNPDVLCNKEIKFGMLLDWVEKNGFDKLATGHFARLKFVNHSLSENRRSLLQQQCRLGSRLADSAKQKPSSANLRKLSEKKVNCISLMQAKDKKKDQTYFLSLLKQEQLGKVMFPVGELTKDEVRAKAKKRGIHVWNKKSTSGICFIGHQISFEDLLKTRVKEHEGEVIDIKGKVIGKHKGVEFYTIGQRHGFEVRQISSSSKALFVVNKDRDKNQLVVGEKESLMRDEFEVEEWSWINAGYELSRGVRNLKRSNLFVRIRHGGKLVEGKIDGNKVRLKEKVFGVAPGQVAVLYGKTEGCVPTVFECLGGGVIKD